MCGICVASGDQDQIANVVEGLKRLDYRGYDSSGVAYIKNKKLQSKIFVVKSVGAIKNLEKKLGDEKGEIVIGHTRWATHGAVNEANAHPHISSSGKFAIVHNGIIENFEELKKQLNCNLYSQTDTEVFVNLIEKQEGTTFERLRKACSLVRGSFAIALLRAGSEKIFLARRGSPLMVANDERSAMAGSDISVFKGRFEECFMLEDNEFASIEKNKVEFFDINGKKIEKKPVFIKNFDFFEENIQEKYFMLKEIKEQPIVLRTTYFKYFSEIQQINWEKLKNFKTFHFVACGTAYHSCLLGARYIKEFCKRDAQVSVASEFRYDTNIFSKSCLYIFVSQSGETADTIACAKLVKEKGLSVLCVTNVPYCSLNKIADFVLPTFAGKEVAVASTKAFSAQVFTLLIFALNLASIRGLKIEGFENYVESLKNFVLSFDIKMLDRGLLQEILQYKKIFFIGREQDYAIAIEGALKLKEIAYLGCIGIAGGELKHGTLALVDNETLVIAISTQEKLKEKIESNILEVKSRGGKILLVSQLQHSCPVEYLIKLSEYEEALMPIVSVIPLQEIALQYCVKLGYNPDKPRNLAKSVTVE